MSWTVLHADCIEAMREMDEASVDAVVCDPPYGIGFMGKEWDGQAIREAAERDRATRKSLGPESASRAGRAQPRSSSAFGNEAIIAGPVRGGMDFQAWCLAWATEALRVLKPGGHLLAFGGTRTYHRLACAVEDAGFEIRDSLIWLQGAGFPKSLDVSKAIDKAAGAEREVVGYAKPDGGVVRAEIVSGHSDRENTTTRHQMYTDPRQPVTAPATPEAQRWQGWGTSLKPGHEPVVVARKPLVGTVAETVLRFGTGALNVDGCRVGTNAGWSYPNGAGGNTFHGQERRTDPEIAMGGRWPANVVLSHLSKCEDGPDDSGGPSFYFEGRTVEEHQRPFSCAPGCPVAELDRQSGERPGFSGGGATQGEVQNDVYGKGWYRNPEPALYGDTGGASRFFYCAKSSRAERTAGVSANAHPT